VTGNTERTDVTGRGEMTMGVAGTAGFTTNLAVTGPTVAFPFVIAISALCSPGLAGKRPNSTD